MCPWIQRSLEIFFTFILATPTPPTQHKSPNETTPGTSMASADGRILERKTGPGLTARGT